MGPFWSFGQSKINLTTMADEAAFKRACEDAKNLKGLGQEDMLEVYSLFKQATVGDCTISRPGMFDPKGQAKYDGWKAKEGTSQDQAKAMYTDFVQSKLAEQ